MLSFDYRLGRPQEKSFNSVLIESVIDNARKLLVNHDLYKLFSQAFPNTLDTTVMYRNENSYHDTYVITGDIDAMWLRDSTAQVWPYLEFMKQDPQLQNLIAGVINRQAHYIRIDPYANAFNYSNEGSIWCNDFTRMRPELHERKWEIDSLCYHIRLSYQYYRLTNDISLFNADWLSTAKAIYQTFRAQQLKDGTNPYRFQRNTPVATDTLADNGFGNRVNPIGLIASSFRPSDDATIFPFLIPANFFAKDCLIKLAEIVLANYKHEDKFILECKDLAAEIEAALTEYAIVEHKKYGQIWAYEVDGFGSHVVMDDANVPSLLSLPYLGLCNLDDPIYQNTRRFILSQDNPWFFNGSVLSGIGSIHTGRNRVWPIAITMQALTSNNQLEIDNCINMLVNSHAGTYFIHEAINKDNADDYSRPWFAWANSLFAELIIQRFNLI